MRVLLSFDLVLRRVVGMQQHYVYVPIKDVKGYSSAVAQENLVWHFSVLI